MIKQFKAFGTSLYETTPFFTVGLLLRLLLIFVIFPWDHEFWFIPFLTSLPHSESIDFWNSFIADGGSVRAFPYGQVYSVVFAPLTLIGFSVGGEYGAQIGLGLTVLLLDILLLRAIKELLPEKLREKVTLVFWLAPITLYIGYWHGQLDVLPTLLLMLSLVALHRSRLFWSAALLAVAVVAKLSMIVAAPFIIIYIYGSPKYNAATFKYIYSLTGLVALLLGPLILLPGFRTMVLGTPELQKSVALSIAYGAGLTLYILPMVYAGLLLLAWRIRPISFSGLMCLIGIVFLTLYLLTPASPGWAMWFVPFMAMHVVRSGKRALSLFIAVNVSFVLLHVLMSTGARVLVGSKWDFSNTNQILDSFALGQPTSWIFSLFTVCLAALGLQMLRERIFTDNFHLASRKSLVIGIAGDSGAGKDTLSDLVADMFGRSATCAISGDDYHSWDRHKPMWRALTHLHPKANDLERFTNDALELSQGRSIRSRHYDHADGRMTKPRELKAKNVVLVSGLHALYPPKLKERCDLKIFLDMHEGLRRYLKIRRDVAVRGHPLPKVISSIETRYPDSRLYIQPQKHAADITISLEPLRASDVEDFERPPEDVPLRLRIKSKQGDDLRDLETLLVSVCGLNVLEQTKDNGEIEVVIEGTPSANDIAIVADKLFPTMKEYLALEPKWHADQHGLLQLVVLDQINRVRAAAGGIL
ncbi:nucleoside/nucleotide kinase family protein [Hirschia baltica]|uniref:phosphoribulokinase n=1 Tax=Hirschia baltica (strain ATCC 49814 / DSM 5838 / IFAM 1418) TaxID=582402 RepID=C6XS35_HIRBI|nr:phosphoribulokinase [Hirschia baltica]ACT60876.1 phosphoribulokinase/uridine kinase [Hirschia baltica ATCC 49814]